MATAPKKRPARKRAAPKKPGPGRTGRPPAIAQPIGDGTETVADRIVSSIAAGNYFEQACAAAGVGKVTAYRWLREGALAARTIASNPDATLEGNAPLYLNFWNAVEEAEGRWEVGALTTLESLGRGASMGPDGKMRGPRKIVETEKLDPQGRVIETSRRTEWLPPDSAVLMWRLERKDPARFGKRVEIAQTIPDPLSRDDKAALIADQAETYLAALADAEESTGVGPGSPADDSD